MFDKPPKLSPKIENPTPTTGITFDAERFNKEASLEVIPPPKTGPEIFLEKAQEVKNSGGGAFSLGQHNFNMKNNLEYGNETIPSREHILSTFKELTQGADFKDIKEPLEDEQGIYRWDIVVTNPDNTTIEYSYTRSSNTTVNVLFLDEDGIPRGGHDAASYVEGNWIFRLE
jgi:hypothetical protein